MRVRLDKMSQSERQAFRQGYEAGHRQASHAAEQSFAFAELWNLPPAPPPSPVEKVVYALRDAGMGNEQAEQLVADAIAFAKQEAQQ